MHANTAMLISALIVVSTTTSADYPSRGSVYPARAATPDVPAKQVDRLGINTSNRVRLVVENRCEADGIRDLLELLKVSQYEEMWAFVPAGAPDSTCTWYEIGREVKSVAGEATVRVDRDFLTGLMRQRDEVHLYHFHPLAYFSRCVKQTGCDALGLPISPHQISREGLIANLRYAMPSSEDIYFMMDVTWQFDRERGGSGRIINRVVTPYGVIDYALTEAGKRHFAADRNLRTAGLYIKLVAAHALLDDNIEQIIARNPESIDDALKQLVQSMNSRHLRVKYIRLETYR